MNDQSSPSDKQRTDEWKNLDQSALLYHISQWQNPKQSTKQFELFLRETLSQSRTVMDLGCGTGAATGYVAERHHQIQFTGVDYSAELVSIGNEVARKQGFKNLTFEIGDWFDLTQRRNVDGVMSLQTLSWLPEFVGPLTAIIERINPRWIAVTSLFFEGDISCRIEVEEHKRNGRKSFYNVYSLPAIERFCKTRGYSVFKHDAFEIDIDIPKPNDMDFMSTYTMRVHDSQQTDVRRIQISGPLLMNWYMVLMERDLEQGVIT